VDSGPHDTLDVRPLSGTRRVVARRMAESARSIPAVTLHRRVVVEHLLAFRDRVGGATGRRPIIDALLAHITARALAEYDLLNARWDEEGVAVAVMPRRSVAIAVDTPRGLTTVVLPDADSRDPIDLDRQLATLVERALAHRSRPEDVQGGTFTLTNLGQLGVDAFTPMITPGQAGILGIGAISGEHGSRSALISLSFDHRVCDGAYAARFLGRLSELLLTAWSPPAADPLG
jgi:pyruvate/2-oxoglutarate dehydrogenase complex dihydrolipoamide acyltransferase (E2) component